MADDTTEGNIEALIDERVMEILRTRLVLDIQPVQQYGYGGSTDRSTRIRLLLLGEDLRFDNADILSVDWIETGGSS